MLFYGLLALSCLPWPSAAKACVVVVVNVSQKASQPRRIRVLSFFCLSSFTRAVGRYALLSPSSFPHRVQYQGPTIVVFDDVVYLAVCKKRYNIGCIVVFFGPSVISKALSVDVHSANSRNCNCSEPAPADHASVVVSRWLRPY